jgi:hypothetical protein
MATSTNPVSQLALTPAEVNFRISYDEHQRYPQNLLHRATFDTTLKNFNERLTASSSALFGGDAKAFVPFRDLKPDGRG